MRHCPHCRHENPGDAKFCLECGRRLALSCGTCGTEDRLVARAASRGVLGTLDVEVERLAEEAARDLARDPEFRRLAQDMARTMLARLTRANGPRRRRRR